MVFNVISFKSARLIPPVPFPAIMRLTILKSLEVLFKTIEFPLVVPGVCKFTLIVPVTLTKALPETLLDADLN